MANVDNTSLFANGPTGSTAPDSLTVGDGSLWAEYGNGADSTGAGGSSTIVQYSLDGQTEHTYTIAGSVDGLKIDPTTGVVWALQNQDGNSTLTLINPATNTVSDPLSYAAPPYVYGADSGRGYDDVAFDGRHVYLSYTNPANPGDPVLQELTNGHVPFGTLTTTDILVSDALGTDLSTGQTGQPIPLSDPDSLKTTPYGGLVFTSGSDNAYTLISDPGTANQTESFVQLQNLPAGSSLDDVIIPTATSGTLYVADSGNDRVLALHLSDLTPGQAIVSLGTEVGTVDTATGNVTALLTDVSKSHGLAFVPSDSTSPLAGLLAELSHTAAGDLFSQLSANVASLTQAADTHTFGDGSANLAALFADAKTGFAALAHASHV